MALRALVTGGQTGIGLGIAAALVGAGHRVALASSSPPDAHNVTRALTLLGSGASYFQHDIRKIGRAASLVDKVEAEIGPPTTYVSNAGVPAKVRGDLLELKVESFDYVMSVNLRGGFFLAQEVAKRMIANASEAYRSIIFITSLSADMTSTMRSEYCISKAGAAMMAKLFAVRLASQGIGVFELRPGIIETNQPDELKQMLSGRIADGLVPAGRWGKPEDVGSIVLPMAEGKMAFATGLAMPVDGGLSLPRL